MAVQTLLLSCKKHEVDKYGLHRRDKYSVVSKDMASSGFDFSARQCKNKWTLEKIHYRKFCDNKRTTGMNRIDYDHSEIMSEICDKEPSTRPTVLGTASSIIKDDEQQQNVVATTPQLSLPRVSAPRVSAPRVSAPKKRTIEEILATQHEEVLREIKKGVIALERIADVMEKFVSK